jgi:hypothetical protein
MKRKAEYVEGAQAFKNFENGMEVLMRASHSDIKAKLDAEKSARKRSTHPPSGRKDAAEPRTGSFIANGASKERTK